MTTTTLQPTLDPAYVQFEQRIGHLEKRIDGAPDANAMTLLVFSGELDKLLAMNFSTSATRRRRSGSNRTSAYASTCARLTMKTVTAFPVHYPRRCSAAGRRRAAAANVRAIAVEPRTTATASTWCWMAVCTAS